MVRPSGGWLVAGVIGLGACGGIAIVDPAGEGGAGATSTATSTSTSVAATTSGDVPSLCAESCFLLGDCASVSDCTADCESQVSPCREAHQAWLSCAQGEASSMCGSVPGTVCSPPLDDYLACMGGFDALSCDMAPDGGCQCSAIAGGGATVLEVVCEPGAGCLCIDGGVEVGFCEPNDAVCGIDDGCCAGVFFTDGL